MHFTQRQPPSANAPASTTAPSSPSTALLSRRRGSSPETTTLPSYALPSLPPFNSTCIHTLRSRVSTPGPRMTRNNTEPGTAKIVIGSFAWGITCRFARAPRRRMFRRLVFVSVAFSPRLPCRAQERKGNGRGVRDDFGGDKGSMAFGGRCKNREGKWTNTYDYYRAGLEER